MKCGSGKRGYGSKREARDAARAIGKRTGRTQWVYVCQGCGLYHTTSHSQQEERRR